MTKSKSHKNIYHPDAIELAKSIKQGKPTKDCPIPFSYVQASIWFANYILEENEPK